MKPTYDELIDLTVDELKAKCKEEGIKGYSGKNEKEIIELIIKNFDEKKDEAQKERIHQEYGKYIKVKINPRDQEDLKMEGWAKLNGYQVQWMWDEPVELPELFVDYLRGVGPIVTTNGKPKKMSRFIIEKL